MLEVKTRHDKGGVNTCTASGDILEISADVAVVIHGIYTQLSHSDPMLAQFFRRNLQKLINDANSPMWDSSATLEGVCIIQPKKLKEDN